MHTISSLVGIDQRSRVVDGIWYSGYFVNGYPAWVWAHTVILYLCLSVGRQGRSAVPYITASHCNPSIIYSVFAEATEASTGSYLTRSALLSTNQEGEIHYKALIRNS